MKIAFIDNSGSLYSVVWRVAHEGHDVIYFIKEKGEEQLIGKGMVPKAKTIAEVVEWHPDACVAYRLASEAKRIANEDIPTFGVTNASLRLEDDRLFAANITESLGIKVPATHRFTNVKDAVEFVENDKTRNDWVFKAQGGTMNVSSTHVTSSKDELLEILTFEGSRREGGDFVLQERVHGVEISIEGWFDYRLEEPWLKPINSTLERKRLMAGDIGPMTGCMGSIVWAWPQARPFLFRQTLEKMTPYLTKIKYVGPLDGNFIIDYKNRQPWFLEWTPRFGWNAFEAVMAGMYYGIGDFFVSLARGEAKSMHLPKNRYMAAIRIYTPMAKGVPIHAPLEDPNVFPRDLYRNDSGTLCTVGSDTTNGLSAILEVASEDDTIKQAVSHIYEELIPLVVAPDLTYRNDIGTKAEEDVELLNEWGYVTSQAPRKHYYPPATVPEAKSKLTAKATPETSKGGDTPSEIGPVPAAPSTASSGTSSGSGGTTSTS